MPPGTVSGSGAPGGPGLQHTPDLSRISIQTSHVDRRCALDRRRTDHGSVRWEKPRTASRPTSHVCASQAHCSCPRFTAQAAAGMISQSRGEISPESCDRCPLETARGRGECRALASPMAACNKARGSHHRFSRTSGIPRAMVLRLYVLSSVHRAFWPPSLRDALASSQVNTSVGVPGPHDFTSAPIAFVSRNQNVHRIPAPRVVTIARNAPLNEAGCAH